MKNNRIAVLSPIVFLLATVSFCFAESASKEDLSIDSGLIGHWKFDGDARDYSVNNNNGKIFGVEMNTVGISGTAAKFNGIDNYIEVADSPSLKLGAKDFSIAVWVNLKKEIDDVIGDIVAKYDGSGRKGFNFYIKGSSGTGCSHGEAKNLHFGIDNAVDGNWTDCGKLATTNTQIWALTVFEGELYAGMVDAYRKSEVAHVYKYGGGKRWVDCGQIGYRKLMHSIHAMIVHDSSLYAASSSPDWREAEPNNSEPACVYKYEGGTKWTYCGQPGENYRIKCFASYKGKLYAGAGTYAPFMNPKSSAIYRYDGGTTWTNCGRLDNNNNELCMMVYNGNLYASGVKDKVYRYDGGQKWTLIGPDFINRQINSLEVYEGKLYVGTWPQGKVGCYDNKGQWTYCGQTAIGEEPMYELQSLTVYNGKLYGGTLPKAEIFRYDDGEKWTFIKRLVTAPNWNDGNAGLEQSRSLDWTKHMPAYRRDTWNRALSLTVFHGKLFATASSELGHPFGNPWPELGRVYSMTAGTNVSYDYDIGTGWKHLTAVRTGGLLKLYVDGELAAVSESFNPEKYDIANSKPLKIGFGSVDYFNGLMDELRIYERALTPNEIKTLSKI